MSELVKIKVEIIKELSGEFSALHDGKLIKIDPFVTDCINEENCVNFDGAMIVSGVWHDEEVFLVDAAESLS